MYFCPLQLAKNMPNPYFKFKQFTIWHNLCAMKVGTDGTLLGAWVSCHNCRTALDIGCGSGLITLMLAQRCQAQIDAIDIDEGAVAQTRINAQNSPFAERITVWHESLQEFSKRHAKSYDLIVSNPPYFIDSLKCPNQQRNTARHTDTLPLHELLEGSRRLLTPLGHLALILPYDQRQNLLDAAGQQGFYLCKETAVRSIPNAAPKRILADFSMENTAVPLSNQLTIEQADHQFTDEFRELAKDFYLKL